MKLVLLGGGGFRVPLVHAKLLGDPDRLVDDLVLHDVDRSRIDAISAVLEQQAAGHSWRPRLHTTRDLDEALAGADVVFSAIRVGGAEGRTRDERVALSEGLLGQETVGPGGICYALRTVPVALDIAERVARVAPDAWLLNFTNPAGIVTEAMSRRLGDRVIGICDSPSGLCHRAARAAGVDAEQARFDYVGLNHLGWLRRMLVDDEDTLPALLADEQALREFEEGRLFSTEWLRVLGAIPNEYLHYFYYARETIAEINHQPRTRGEYLLDQQGDFYRAVTTDPAGALATWRHVKHAREETYLAEARGVSGSDERSASDWEAGGYDEVALRLMWAIARNTPDSLILNVRNQGAVPGFDDDAVVEVPCRVDGTGAHPLPTGPVEGHFDGLMRTVKAVERDTINAATTRSRKLALRALGQHPLVDSVAAASRALDSYSQAFPELHDLGATQ